MRKYQNEVDKLFFLFFYRKEKFLGNFVPLLQCLMVIMKWTFPLPYGNSPTELRKCFSLTAVIEKTFAANVFKMYLVSNFPRNS